MFLVGALIGREQGEEQIGKIPEQIRKVPQKSGKSQKGQKRTNRDGYFPVLKPPRLAALNARHDDKNQT